MAATVAYAEALVSEAKDSVTWSVAENFRFLDSFIYGQEEVKNLGKILGFRVKRFSPVKQGWKFFGETHPDLRRVASDGNNRNAMAQDARVSRRVPS